MRNLRRRRIAIITGLAFCAPAVHAAEANYPARSIRMVVPFVAGRGTDLLAPRMSELLGQQIVVDNRGGAGSVLGTQIVAKSPADGYTLGSTGKRIRIIRHILRDQIIHRRRPA